ncbi:MAG: phosphomannomutase [Thermodesulfobacteriota bacterium]|nr:phosphomannomutase [Thermodesulfobacteriota bacterium]
MRSNVNKLSCFKAYDVRGKVPDELNEDIAFNIGRAYAQIFKPKKIVIGYDVRLSSKNITDALEQGITKSGVDVVNIELCGAEQIYFAAFHLKMDGGIMVTASHNPSFYNGMKFVRERAVPISSDSGLADIEKAVIEKNFPASSSKGKIENININDDYKKHILSYIDTTSLKSFKVVSNAGNGCAGPIIDLLEKALPFNFIKLNNKPDGTFPSGVPNPLLAENRKSTESAVKKERANVGIAWDGDFDRCFFFDEKGTFIDGYYIVGLLAEHILKTNPGEKIIHDPRVVWNTIELVKKAGGVPIQSKAGHAFMKEKMRAEDAIYGGEMSAHHFFRKFSYCDSGMIPWLLVLEIMSVRDCSLSLLVEDRIKQYPSSGEINCHIKDTAVVTRNIIKKYREKAEKVDTIDGVSMEFELWRFNLRPSNTEPFIRLNVESKRDHKLMEEKTEEILEILQTM